MHVLLVQILLIAGSALLIPTHPPRGAPEIRLDHLGSWAGEVRKIVVRGDVAYVASGLRLIVLDVSDPAHPRQIGVLDLGGRVFDLVVEESTALLAMGSEGLAIVDVADPTRPTLVSRNADALDSPDGVVALDDVVYLVGSDMHLFDYSNRRVPEYIDHFRLDRTAGAVAASRDYIYAAESMRGWMHVIDARDPLHPTKRGSVDTGIAASAIAVDGTRVYVCHNKPAPDGGISTVNVTDPDNPVVQGHYQLEHVTEAAVADGLLYVMHSGALSILDLREPDEPRLLATTGWLGADELTVAVADGIAFVGDERGILTLDVSDPSRPHVLGRYDLPSWLHRTAVDGETMYVTDAHGFVHVVDISDPATPELISSYETGSGNTNDIVLDGGLAYIAVGDDGAQIVSLEDPRNPVLLSSIPGVQDCWGIAVQGNMVYLGERYPYGRFHVFDVSNPYEPRFLGGTVLSSNAIEKIEVSGDFAFVDTVLLTVVDISDPSNPTEIGRYERDTRSIDLDGDYLYVGLGTRGEAVEVFEVSDPYSLQTVGWYDARQVRNVLVEEGVMYVGAVNFLALVDVHDPRNPIELFRTTAFRPIYATLAGDQYVVTENFRRGVTFLQFDKERPGDTWYVDPSATGRDDGTSWSNAFESLDSGLAAASRGDEVRVAGGTYVPTSPNGGRLASFRLPPAVKVRGGYAGAEAPDPNHREFVLHESVLSGDRLGDDQPGFGNYDDNIRRVVTGENLRNETLLEGFTVRNGYIGLEMAACDTAVSRCRFVEHQNGAVVSDEGSPTMQHCTFQGSTSFFGAAFESSRGGAPRLEDCRFIQNSTDGAGGALYLITVDEDVHVRDCQFLENVSNSNGGAGYINAVRSTVRFTNCEFIENRAIDDGGAIAVSESSTVVLDGCRMQGNSAGRSGGAVHVDQGICRVERCNLTGNAAASRGGAIYARGDLEIRDSVVSGNHSSGAGGGLYSQSGSTVAINNTIYANEALDSGGGFYVRNQNPEVLNSIYWANMDRQGGGEPAQLFVDNGTPDVHFTIVEGWTGEMGGIGNSGDSPRFVNPIGPDGVPGTIDDDLRLSSKSPAIGAGDPEFMPEPGQRDLDGHARVLCDRVDMGAYEFGIGDYECDRDVDIGDFEFWPNCMTGPNEGPYPKGCHALDADFDGDIDLRDFSAFGDFFGG